MSTTDAAPPVVQVANRIRSLMFTAPDPGASKEVWMGWLARKADLFESIASSASDPGLADEATQIARAVRTQIVAAGRGGPFPYLSETSLINAEVKS